MSVLEIAKKVKEASRQINLATTKKKNEILYNLKLNLSKRMEEILSANRKDIENAKNNNMSLSKIERLTLNSKRIKSMEDSIEKVISLKDPINETLDGYVVENGLKIEKIRVPLGVVGVIYESRPNVTIDSFVFCIKSSNAVLLRGGKEAIETNKILVILIRDSLEKAGFSPYVVGFIECLDRSGCLEMMKLNGILDVLIPRGGAGLIKTVVENATVPVIETGTGNCHVYVDQYADFDMALNIIYNAKTSRPSVCNALESLLVHKSIAKDFLIELEKKLKAKNVEIFGCEKTLEILPNVKPATEEDYYTEYLDYRISIKIVDDVEKAVEHINKYSSKHSESIITKNYLVAEYFLKYVDSAAIYVNASTRFTDGGEFGFGGEIVFNFTKI